jgi:hypothetical protein
MAKVLFVLKCRDALYTDENYSSANGLSSGLQNSAEFIVNMLNDSGIEAKLVQVPDNSFIDREVHAYQPTHVIIEAYWVVPEKFNDLLPLHPNVKWIIRNHSAISFLSTEGIALDWTMRYLNYPNVYVAPNSKDAYNDMKCIASCSSSGDFSDKILYLPNYYTFSKLFDKPIKNNDVIDIGIFGAIRPLKNQLLQVITAIEFAKNHGKQLRVHINGTRIENGGGEPLKNIRGLFKNLGPDFTLVEHTWMCHDTFLKLVASMDMLLCVSFTETFCIVAADGVSMGIPLITSSDVVWASDWSIADPVSSRDILEKMYFAWNIRKLGILQWVNKMNLKHNVAKAKKQWLKVIATM